jgi:hypothetical protein
VSTVGIHMNKIAGKNVKAQWYDPREGTWREIGSFTNTGTREFVPPSTGEQNDWVLVLEDAGRNYPVAPPKSGTRYGLGEETVMRTRMMPIDFACRFAHLRRQVWVQSGCSKASQSWVELATIQISASRPVESPKRGRLRRPI